MKSVMTILALGGAFLLGQAQPLLAQNSTADDEPPAGTPPAAAPPTKGKPEIIPPINLPDRPGLPDRPDIPGRSDPSESLRNLIREFQMARQAFLMQQRELLRNIKEATKEQRAIIREELQQNLTLWLEEQKSHVRELRDQAREIRNNVPGIGDVIDAAKEEQKR